MTTTIEPASAVEEKVLAAENLPTLTVVALKVLELTQMPDVSVNEIARVVQNDPALSGRILKLANSSMFGMSRKIASLQQAMVILGLRTVKVMVLSFSLVESFSGEKQRLLDFSKYWRRSLSMAVGAKLLAEAVSDSRRDEAFVGGLLADIGIIAAHRAAPEEYAPVLTAYAEGKVPIQEVELDQLGVTHARLSGRLLSHWSLPDLLCDAVAAHHGEGIDALEDRTRMLASVLWAAATIADLFCGDVDSTTLDQVKQRCVEITGIEPAALENVLEALDAHVTETASLFSLDIGQTASYEEIRTRAMTQLAAMSMDAELGRVEATRWAETVSQELEELSDQAEALRQQANTDPLTQIGNRQAFGVGLIDAIQHARESNGSLGLILLDLDHFKQLNDTYGHQAGDEVLRTVGRCLSKISEGPNLAARYGGEEFAVIVTDATVRALRELAEDIRKCVERTRINHNGAEVQVTASLGAAHVSFAHELADAKEIVERADECLYSAKRAGRNRVEIAF
ncbi:MAG: sensor domain-containing diguanylate cyclase [Planctomycetota bacterium]|jgi:diguanylate cyclase (GGDEF)-like protein